MECQMFDCHFKREKKGLAVSINCSKTEGRHFILS